MTFYFNVLLYLSLTCGAYSARLKLPPPSKQIMNGLNVTSMANFGYLAYLITPKFLCGGSIISKNFILTAAHCVFTHRFKPQGISTRVGHLSHSQGISYTANKVFVHRNYFQKLPYDVALVRLSQNISYSNSIFPIALTNSSPPLGKSLVVLGWGQTEQGLSKHLIYTNITVNNCTTNIVSDFCGSIGSCIGDSGGPAVADNLQYGIVSYGNHNCTQPPSYYIDVAKVRDWINTIVTFD